LPTRSAGLLPARLPGSVRTAPRTAQTLLLTASRKRPIADRAAIGSPVSIINGEKSTHKITHRNTRCYSISIIPIRITATAAPAASFLPPNRKRLGLNSEAYSKLVAEASPMLANGDSPTMAFKLRFAGSASPVTLFFPLFMRFSCPPACGVDPFPVSPFVFPKERVAALAPLARAELIDIGRERCHSLHHDKLSARCKVTLSPSRPLMKGRPHGRPSSTSITGLARPSNNRPGPGLSRGCYCLSGRVNIVGKR
jgi:hypothetical protein